MTWWRARGTRAILVVATILTACGPTGSATTSASTPAPTASPAPTFSAEQLQMLDFIRGYAAIRTDYLRAQPKPSGAFTAAQAISVYRQRWNFTNEIARRILLLSRSVMTRAFIEDAEAATQVQASSESTWMNVWQGNYTSAGMTADLAKANADGATAQRLWRELDDRVEDALIRVGLDWSPVGGRPAPWFASLQ